MTEQSTDVASMSTLIDALENDRCVELYSWPVSPISSAEIEELRFGPCPVCRGDCGQALYEIGPDRDRRLVVCRTCGLGCLSPLPSSSELASFYVPTYYGDCGNKFNQLIEFAVRFVSARQSGLLARSVPKNGRILDVGCGRGVALRALVDQGFEVYGHEISLHAVRGIDPRIQVRIAPSLAEANFPEAFFDKIVFWHVLEHTPNPHEVLIEAHRTLKPGGVIIVAVPNFSSWQATWAESTWFHLDPPRHLFHFPLPALVRLLKEIGFSIRSEHHFSLRQNPFGWVQSLLNRFHRLPRNGLYVLLQRRPPNVAPPFSWRIRWLLWCAFLLAMPWALLLSIVAAVFRRGATIHVIAMK